MNKIEIEIPEGKKAEWVNGVLTLVDKKPQDITERIKTFDDACKELGEEHPLVSQYYRAVASFKYEPMAKSLLAYLELRIICTVLNEGWIPALNEDKYRYYPWFDMYNQSEYEAFNKNEKRQCFPLKPYHNADAFSVIRCTGTHSARSCSYVIYGIWCTFKTEKLAEYCGRQFISIWADYLLR